LDEGEEVASGALEEGEDAHYEPGKTEHPDGDAAEGPARRETWTLEEPEQFWQLTTERGSTVRDLGVCGFEAE
jgi:hypothetical protein